MKFKQNNLLNFRKNKDFYLGFYFVLIVFVSLIFIGIKSIAQVEDTPYVLREYLKGQACPSFVNKNNLTMKDECTGLVWSRRELPTYTKTKDAYETTQTDPGYSWQTATDTCANLVKIGGVSMFRLPTAEELLTLLIYKCDNTGCQASLADSALDYQCTGASCASSGADGSLYQTGGTIATMKKPFFSQGIYWTSSDFQEDPSWTNPASIPSGKATRDYKRSVNVNTGEVDNPVFNKDMRLNAWCIVEHNQEVLNMEFTQVNSVALVAPDGGTVGQQVTEGNVRITYNRTCQVKDDCNEIGSDLTVNCDTATGYCYKDLNSVPTTPTVIGCLSGYHIEAGNCVSNAEADLCWRGNVFNGIYGCEIRCGDGVRQGEELCDGTDGIATSPADSSSTKQYACTPDCQFTGGWMGDGIKNGSESICDLNQTQACVTTFSAGLPSYCSFIPISGSQVCNSAGTGWGNCVAADPETEGSTSTACASTSITLTNYSCCELTSCINDACTCCGRGVATAPLGYDVINTMGPCTGASCSCSKSVTGLGTVLCNCGEPGCTTAAPVCDSTNYPQSCVLAHNSIDAKQWFVGTYHTTAAYRCWR